MLYLDNTYCSPECQFPSREATTQDIIDIIQSHPDHDVVLGLRSLGKESLLCKIAMSCQEWISVPSKLYETLQLLNAPNVFQNNVGDCRIRVEPFHKISNKFVEELNKKTDTIAILPTAIYCGIDTRPFDNNKNVFVIPYSDHSCYTELMQLVAFLKPCKILPVVSGSARGPFGTSVSNRADMSRFDKYLNVQTTAAGKQIPESVLKVMKGRAFLPLKSVKQGTKRRAKKQLRNGPAKVVKRGVAYEGSPEKSVEQQASVSVLPEDRILNIQSNNSNQEEILTSLKTFGDIQNGNDDFNFTVNQDLVQADGKEKTNVDNGYKLETVDHESADSTEIAASQGFIVTGDFNSDDEETVVSVGFEFDSNISELDNDKNTFNLRNSDNCPTVGENASCLGRSKVSSEFRLSDSPIVTDEIDQNTDEFNVKPQRLQRRKVKMSLDFVTAHKSYKIANTSPKTSVGNNKCHKLVPYAADKGMIAGLEYCEHDEKVHTSQNDDGITLGSSVDKTRIPETLIERESQNLSTDCESQSVLNSVTNTLIHKSKDSNMRKSLNTRADAASEMDKENDASGINCDLHVSDEKEENVRGVLQDEGASQSFGSSVIMISSDSEQTLLAESQISENTRERLKAVDELFNDTEPSSAGSQSQAVSGNSGGDVAGETEDADHIHSQSVPDNILRVIKWQPNLQYIRKCRFHAALTRFIEGMKM